MLQTARQHHQAGRLDQAERIYRQILAEQPDHAEANFLLGLLQYQQNRFRLAADSFRRAAELNPALPGVYYNLGLSQGALGDTHVAIASFRKAISMKPDNPPALNSLGNLLRAIGQTAEAIAIYRKSLEQRPDAPNVWSNLGIALQADGQSDAAIAAFEKAISIDPNLAEVHSNLGNVLWNQGKLIPATAACREAIRLRPELSEPHNNLGNILRDMGDMTSSVAEYQQAVALAPHDAAVHSNWIYAQHYYFDGAPKKLLEQHLAWNDRHAKPLAGSIPPHGNDRNPDRRLRIGYVSADFRRHSVAYFLEKLFAHHDAARVELFAYSDVLKEDDFTRRIQQTIRHWRAIRGLGDDPVAQQIRADRIDILVDLAGHTADNRLTLFARKPAPIQVTYCGYPDTTGMTVMDYRLTDANADPVGSGDLLATEKLARLPDCFLCYSPPADSPSPQRAAWEITFGSFNNIAKISPVTVRLWSEILRKTPGSRLMIKNMSLSEAQIRNALLTRFAGHGVAPERLELLGPLTGSADHLTVYNQIDVALDTFPYHGTATTCESLWMGVPVVTLGGNIHASRVGPSLLHAAGLADWIAGTPEDYVSLAVARAVENSMESRADLRRKLLASPLTDGPRFARAVEAAYRKMWQDWLGNRQPSSSIPH
jgi:predicted O-linked N-acetylglucosamine transferase (SPINDLY family)